MADLKFTGERIVPEADNCEPTFAEKMYQEHVARYLFASQLISGRSVVDVGCGVGYGARILAERGAARVRAFDLSAEAIAHARRHYAHPAVTFEVDSAEAFDFGEKFDVVTCFELIEHVNDYLAVFERIAAALKPDGFVVMSTPRALESKRTDFHTKEFSLVDFRQLFRKYFKRHHFYFENNHFASLIADRRPVSIESIEALQEQYFLDQADYFIVVATRSTKLAVDHLKPVIALNDDKYVLNLERDVAILHRAEDNLKQQLNDREAELSTARQQLQSTVQQLAAAEQAAADVHAQLAQAAANADSLRTEQQERTEEIALARDLVARRDSALEGFREELRVGLSEGAALQARLRSAEALVGEPQARLAAREEAIEALRGELVRSEEQAVRLSQHADLLAGQLQDAGSRLSEQSRSHEQSLSLMAQQTEALLGKLEQTESSWASRNEELRRQFLDATSQIERLHLELAEARGLLEAQATEHRIALKTACDEADRLGRGVEDLERARERAVQEVGDTTKQLEVLKVELAALRLSTHQEISDLRRERDEERSERAKVEAGLAMTRASTSAIELEKSILSADVESLRVQLDRAAAEAAYLTRLVEMMRDSRSWKMTSPLRSAAHLARMARLHGHRTRHYREVNGTWALLRAVGRKVRRRLAGEQVKVEMPPALPTSTMFPPVVPEPAVAADALVDPASGDVDALSAGLDGLEMFIGCWEGESKRYRVHNVAAALRAEGCRVEVKPFSELPLLVAEGRTPRIVVFFRSPYHSAFGVEPFFDYARRLGIKVVFDIDDLVFDPTIVHLVDAFHGLSESDKALYMDGVHKYRRMLLESDAVTVTTDFLVDEVRKLGKPVSIVRNSINAEQLKVADRIIKGKVVRSPRQPVVIGYFSGSNTHQKDFAQAEAALLRVMRDADHARMLIVGYLDLGDAWREFEHRIDRQGFLPYLEMLEVLGRCDINVAPLEVGNPFCESKSELKYFEAAIVQVPTVASSTGPFKSAIESGVTGYIAESEDDWYRALMALVSDCDLRDRIGRAARVSSIDRFGPRTVARQALDSYGVNAPSSSNRTARERLRIDWVVPPIIIGGGGHRNIFRAAHHLQEFGHDVHLHIAGMNESDEQLARIIRENFYAFRGHVRRYDGSFERTDVVFATHWSTVDAALRAKDLAREIMYFVQDFEPAFAPMGSEYVLAENTYRLGLYHVTSGPWCEQLLRSQFGAVADHFRFPIDKDIYFPRPRTVTHKRLVFFAKPEMPRRCFELGTLALRQVKSMRPGVEIVMFGSPHAAKQNLDFPVTFLKVVPTLEGLAEMYSNADAGMVFSTTNPSLVPYEMMACGLPVIDLDRPGNEVNYSDRRDIALLANPLPDVMARQVVELLDSDEQRAMRSRNGLEFSASFPTEEEMARRIESLIMNRLRTKGKSPAPLTDAVVSE